MGDLDVARLGQLLRALRATTSQKEVEEHTGIQQYQISNLESGKIEKPNVEAVARLAQYYGISLNALISECGIGVVATSEWSEQNLDTDLARQIRVILSLASRGSAQEQHDLSIRLEAAIDAQRRAMETGQSLVNGLVNLPSWLQPKPANGDG